MEISGAKLKAIMNSGECAKIRAQVFEMANTRQQLRRYDPRFDLIENVETAVAAVTFSADSCPYGMVKTDSMASMPKRTKQGDWFVFMRLDMDSIERYRHTIAPYP